MENSETDKENTPPKTEEIKHSYALYTYKNTKLDLIQTNLNDSEQCDVQKLVSVRLEKALIYPGSGAVVSFVQSANEESGKKSSCYVFVTQDKGDEDKKIILCFISSENEALDLFHVDLESYCTELFSTQTLGELQPGCELPTSFTQSLKEWHNVAVGYLCRCVQALQENLKFLIHSALLDEKLITSGGTTELQSDIQRFYNACSLSDILSQLREKKLLEDGAITSSVDLLVDAGTSDNQGTITVSLSADSVKLDSNGCNKYCEEWANALNRPGFLENPVRLRQFIEAFKLKFIQTMNTLKRLLREAETDFYALYRSYMFLRDSGNSDILLHYVTAEMVIGPHSVLKVLQDFMQEQEVS